MGMSDTQQSGWTGWAVFAGVVLIILGAIDAIFGLVAILNPTETYLLVGEQATFLFDIAGWGWWHLLIGLLLIAVGLAVLRGATWGRVVAVILVSLNAISQVFLFGAQPWWSLIAITLDVIIIYALTVHGRELQR
jgi:hypothetical protein